MSTLEGANAIRLGDEEVIDSRDVIARIDYLESDEDRDEEEQEELDQLKALAEEAEGYAPDWQYGEALILDRHFIEYAQQLAEDIGAINPDASWPLSCIDWEEAADQLKQDYSAIDVAGHRYWVR